MANTRNRSPQEPARPLPTTPGGIQNHMVNLAVQLAEQQLRDGTASPTVVTHYLKLGTLDYEIQLEKLRNEAELAKARAQQIASSENMERLAAKAIEAFGRYTGGEAPEDDEEY